MRINPLQAMQSAINSLRQNPAQFLRQRGINIPQGMTDGNAILDQLTRSGQFSQQRINQAYQQAQQMGFKR